MSSPLHFSVTIGFKDVYSDFDRFDLNAEMKKLPSVSAIKAIAHYNAQIHTKEKNNELQLHFFEDWIRWLKNETSEKIKNWIGRILSKKNTNVNLFNNRTSLEFLECIYENYNGVRQEQEFTQEQHELFFRCYTYISQLWVDKTRDAIPKSIVSINDYIKVIFPLQFPMIEIIEFKDFRIQFIKAVYFFKFCENSGDYAKALDAFLKNKKAESWRQYLLNVIGPYVSILAPSGNRQGHSVSLTMKDDSLEKFFDSICADPPKYKKLSDYKFLREYPLFKDGVEYLFVFMNFFIDKLYQGLKFDFGGTIVKSGVKINGNLVNSLLDFLPNYASDFAEKYLFYQIIEYCFGRRKNYILKRGDELKELLENGEPDYYMRDRAKIYLFEFKDILISQAAKNSNNYDLIIEELDKKLYQNEKGKPKGIFQLANTVESINKNVFSKKKVDEFEPSRMIIYPIIIFTDYCLNTRGVNYYLNAKFTELLKSKGIDTSNIRPLVLIDIDSLIKFQDLFNGNIIAINQCLNYFHEVFQGSSVNNKSFTFNMAIHEIASKYKYDTPKMFLDEVKPLIEGQGYTTS